VRRGSTNSQLVRLALLLSLSAVHCADSTAVIEYKAVADTDRVIALQNCSDPSSSHIGVATFYRWADGSGNCSFDPTPNDLMVAAMNHVDYAGSAVCGSSVSITGPRGRVTVRIVDQCGDCPEGHVDLSPQAFARIADTSLGIVPIKWRYVATAVQGNIIYHFKNGSNQWWTAVQVRNHRNPIAKFEYRTSGGQWVTVPRVSYNYFVQTNPGMGVGPYTFRVTDMYSHTLTDSGIPFIENGTVNGARQFPPGP
jgi:expansin (peptidoglycan-binding protein)